jgi:flagellar protein FliO/FliZ
MTPSPRQKLAAAALCLLALPVIAAAQGGSAAGAARVALGLMARAGRAGWFSRGGGVASKFKAAPRLQVVQRAGLSQRTGVALIEVDGQPYLVVHGDGFARLQPVRKPRPLTALSEPVEDRSAPPSRLSSTSSDRPELDALAGVGDEC